MDLGVSNAVARPNFLIVVLDCARAQSFPGTTDPLPGMPFLTSLGAESVRFPRTAAVSPWTIPSHASLFTGLYPWEHRVHFPGDLRLKESIPTLASMLERAGYATASISSNGFIGPDLGLTRGFSTAAWGDWWERYWRSPHRSEPPRSQGDLPVQRRPPGALWKSLEVEARLLQRDTLLLNLMNQALRFVHNVPDGGSLPISPWVEPTLGSWLQRQPRERPVMAFVNLFDAHEPYLTYRRASQPLGAWWRSASLRQDRANYFSQRFTYTGEEWDRLRELYQGVMRLLDHRVAQAVEAFRSAGRWEDTWLVVTSDHGQSFGEHGHMFHQAAVWEELLRVPLWLRAPGGVGGGTVAKGWASLVDIAPTLVSLAGITAPPRMSGQDLRGLVGAPRAGPVLALGDGVPPWDPLMLHAPPQVVSELNHPWSVAYQGRWKVSIDLRDGRLHLYDVEADPTERVDLGSHPPPETADLVRAAQETGTRIRGQPPFSQAPEVSDRLRSWGY